MQKVKEKKKEEAKTEGKTGRKEERQGERKEGRVNRRNIYILPTYIYIYTPYICIYIHIYNLMRNRLQEDFFLTSMLIIFSDG